MDHLLDHYAAQRRVIGLEDAVKKSMIVVPS
jgi:hypothetical protein